ncbi:MAG: AMP-binding protein [Actinomycetota bacterium]|nr:AMP-binding protein [Actinomycetota bacterium]MDG1488686.1 AMP-binding protein [Actinomycetota bacterium]MDG2121557.1 AMP-binding protein [Actinomycetota bacterium]
MIPGRRVVSSLASAKYYQNGWWRDETLLDDFLAKAAENPERPALVSYAAGQDKPIRHTYGELELLSRRCAAALIDLGVEKDEAVSVQLPNSWEFPALTYGIMRAGAIANPLVPIFRSREIEFILGRTKSRVLVVPNIYRGFDYAAMALELREKVSTLEHVVVLGPDRVDSISFNEHFVGRSWEEDPDLSKELSRRLPVSEDLVEIQFTSGTTGEPKGVLHSYNTVFSGAQAIDKIYGLESDDVCFMASTLAHQTGFCYGLLKPLAMGMKVVYQDVWDAGQMLDAVETEKIVWTLSATAFAMDMVAEQRRTTRDLSSFKFFICGGAAIPPKVVEDAAEVLGAQLIALWGMTENMVVTSTRPGDSVELVSNSDGTPVEWMEIRLMSDDGEVETVGESGNLQTRGASQALGYFHREDLYDAATPEEDWFDTGDVARLRSDGGIRIVGRTKDIVIRGGENIPVAEIESLILRYPGVDEVAIIGLPDERLGERACAVVSSSNPTLTLSAISKFLEDLGTAKQFWPEELVLMTEMPRTPSGKIQKFRLREELSA